LKTLMKPENEAEANVIKSVLKEHGIYAEIKSFLTKIRNLSKERAEENWSFRTFFKGYDIEHLDLIVHELFEEVSEAIDCTTCGNCCKEIQPILKKKDINKLSKSLNIKPDQFITKYVHKDETGESR